MKLFNTLSRKLEDVRPITAGEISLYTCGPTVYDYAHIGNLRNVIFNDTLRRMLETSGLAVNHVRNLTDVGHLTSDADEGDDKLEKGAEREGKTVWEVADFYIDAFHDDASALNILPPTTEARATDFVPEQLALVETLVDKGFGYVTDQAIYFDVTKLDDYGKLTGQKLEGKVTAARDEVVVDANKRSPEDFALWFFATGHFADHTMRWPSQWGDGFPGWHLECSAIIAKFLGNPIDIHTGGVDHIGTHHTNEIAQTEAATGKPLANLWVHSEFLQIEGEKIAKSAGNFLRLRDLVERGYHPLSFRLLMLQSHYRSQVNFTWEALEAAQHFLLGLYGWAELSHQTSFPELPDEALEPVKLAVADDLGTPTALAELAKLTGTNERPSSPMLATLDDLFGLDLRRRGDITSQQKQLIADRQTARGQKDFTEADRLRTELEQEGISLDDTEMGPRWSRATI